MAGDNELTVWERLRKYADTQSADFTSQEVLSWFRRHAPSQANDRTLRTHVRGACWNVEGRAQFSHREPFLTRIDRGLFRRASSAEIKQWRSQRAQPDVPAKLWLESELIASPTAAGEWHTEANVQRRLVDALRLDGWSIASVANTATKEPGIDVIASREGRVVGIEVKGYPSSSYADPKRAHEVKRTRPSTQASHWYAQAVLAAMRLRGKKPTWNSVIALPDFPRYRDLHDQTAGSLSAAQIKVWWVNKDGLVARP